jgi:hypothetical protein
LSCNCDKKNYATSTTTNPGEGSVGGSETFDGAGSASPFPSAPSNFCWKCFAFWALVALVVYWILAGGE